jgi:prolyl oligopeptidase
LILWYLQDVKSTLLVHDLPTGELVDTLDIPIGAVNSLSGRRQDKCLYFGHASFLNPGIIFCYDTTDRTVSEFRTTTIGGHVDTTNLETRQVFVESKDGTQVPVFITCRKDLVLDGTTPTLLYGYGGFSISLTPMFSASWLAFLLHFNGCLALANLRGGGEYGEEWHLQGTLDKKQNVFDDFQSVAKWLCTTGYTKPAKLAIQGGSNGGLLIGACVNQAPELFGCAVADVGVMDMLRFHKFTIGHAWKSDYGDPDASEDFAFIHAYSPLHNVRKDNTYPAMLLCTGDHDDRVVPLHSLKLAAELQYWARWNPNPLMMRVDTKAGHGAGKPTKKRIDEVVDKFVFVSMALDAPYCP